MTIADRGLASTNDDNRSGPRSAQLYKHLVRTSLTTYVRSHSLACATLIVQSWSYNLDRTIATCSRRLDVTLVSSWRCFALIFVLLLLASILQDVANFGIHANRIANAIVWPDISCDQLGILYIFAPWIHSDRDLRVNKLVHSTEIGNDHP